MKKKSCNHYVLVFLLFIAGTAHAQFTKERMEEFKKLTQSRVEDFQNYLSIVVDKARSDQERNEAIELAMGLFTEGAKMQVTGRDKSTKRVPIEAYLNSLKNLKYAKVKITNYGVAAVTDFEKGADDKYYAVATYFQRFEGTNGNGASYADQTKKKIAVTGEQIDKVRRPNDLKIYFGDVTVEETTPVNGN